MSKSKLGDVDWLTVDLVPVTHCEPPSGAACFLQHGSSFYTAAEAKRHALDHPGHVVVRESVKRTTYALRGTVTDV